MQPSVEIPYRPSTILYGSDAFELMLAGIAQAPELDDALLAVRWSAGDNDRLGPIGEGFTVLNNGTGLATSPIGFQRLDLVAFSGTGLATSPIVFTAMDLFSPLGTAPSLGMGMNGIVLFLADGILAGASRGALNPSTQALLTGGGFVTAEGFEAASLLAGSGYVSVGLSAVGDTVAMSEQGQKVD